MNIPRIQPRPKTDEIPLEQIAGNKSLSEPQKIAEVSRQFESVLLRQILGAARKTVFKSKVQQDSLTSGIYHDMVTNKLADSIAHSGSFGLARSLETQLIRQTTANPTEPERKP